MGACGPRKIFFEKAFKTGAMQIKLFTVPVGDSGGALQEINAFLRGNIKNPGLQPGAALKPRKWRSGSRVRSPGEAGVSQDGGHRADRTIHGAKAPDVKEWEPRAGPRLKPRAGPRLKPRAGPRLKPGVSY